MIIRTSEGLSQQIFNDLKKKIEEFEYKPGDRISETSLAEIYQVSRTPIKHSLARLENDDLIIVKPQVGTFIAKIDTQRVSEFFTIRKLLETAIINDVRNVIDEEHKVLLQANIAQQKELLDNYELSNEINIAKDFWNLDNEFHRIIFSAINKEFVWEFILSQSSQFNRFRVISAAIDKDGLSQKIQDHEAIANYLFNPSVEIDVNNLYNEHLFSTLDATIANLTAKYPDYFC